jgi:acyl-CoA synthetase (NDP forming)
VADVHATARPVGGPGAAPASTPAPRRAIDLRALFAPSSIAIVGASPRSGIAQTVRDNLRVMGAETPVRFVNPRYDQIDGTPTFASLADLPEPADQVILAVNPLRAARFTEEAALAGARSVVIPGGGVVEGGAAAEQMQRDVRRLGQEHGLTVLGPNCMGWVDWTTRCAAYIGDVSPYLPRGHVAGLAQSGSVTDAFIHTGTRIGFSRIVSVGAEAVLDLCDYLAYCLDDPETYAVMLFVEGFKRPERFLALADHALAIGKPILALKVGRSDQAQAAAVAHSGNLAGEDRVTDAALEAAGVVRCGDLDELHEAAELFAATRRLARGVGRGRTGVVTVSTGEASLIADLVPRTGVDLPPVPDVARAALLERLPTMGYIGNPLDPWGADDPEPAYRAAFEVLADSGAYDVLVLVHDSPYRELPSEVQTAETVVRPLIDATRDRPELLPVYVSLTSGEISAAMQATLDAAGGIPLLRGAVEAFAAIARRAWWERRHAERRGGDPVRPAWPGMAADRTTWADDPGLDPVARSSAAVELRPRAVSERESLAVLGAAGVPVTRCEAAADAASAVAAWERLGGGSVAVKLDADGVAHKSDIDAVRVGLVDADAVRRATEAVLEAGLAAGATVRGVLVQPMAPPGVELIVGARRDAVFGPAVLVGLGGILAEVLDDVAVALAPITPDRARQLIDRLHGAAILHGVRGRPGVDLDTVARLVVALGELLVAREDVLEVDLNPVIASPGAVVAVDALVVIADPR